MEKISGIYKIENLINHKVYIGISNNIYGRWEDEKNTQPQGSGKRGCPNTHLWYQFEKYGRENFSFEIIKKCSKEDMIDLEPFFIRLYQSWDPRYGYNKTFGGPGHSGVYGYRPEGEKNSMFGKHGKDNPNSRRIECIETKEIFESGVEAQQKTGLSRPYIVGICTGKGKPLGETKTKRGQWKIKDADNKYRSFHFRYISGVKRNYAEH